MGTKPEAVPVFHSMTETAELAGDTSAAAGG